MDGIRKLLLTFLINAASVALVASTVPGIAYTGGLKGLAIITLIFAGVNLLVKPILGLLSLPVEVATIGVFTIVINATMLIIMSSLVKGFTILPFPFPGFHQGSFIIAPFTVPAFGTAIVGAVLIGILVSFLYWLTKR